MKLYLAACLFFLSGNTHTLPINFYQAEKFSIISDTTIYLPAGGNTWAKNKKEGQHLVTDSGIGNWRDPQTYFDTWLRINTPGSLIIRVKAKTDGQSRLQLSVNGVKKEILISGNELKLYPAGEWRLKDTGYCRIKLKGISKTGQRFADINGFEISGTTINSKTAFVENNEGNFFYWGRRGPSVHLNYPLEDTIDVEWFYNEVTVPKGQDVTGSYFMACGFKEGYFGMQVNSSTERRILFSVWSPFSTDDPKSIPDSMKLTMLKKGANVHTGEFGNEGSGGQSYMRYNWKAGNTYKFLISAHPNGANNTSYTAYFFAPEKNSWMLIASFKRPQTNTYLKHLHSFLENFIPGQGDKQRMVLFGNQWIVTANDDWKELNNAVFTYDNTAAKGYRMDYAGGSKNNHFFLQNCGFFNHYTAYKTSFKRQKTNARPHIDLRKLP